MINKFSIIDRKTFLFFIIVVLYMIIFNTLFLKIVNNLNYSYLWLINTFISKYTITIHVYTVN